MGHAPVYARKSSGNTRTATQKGSLVKTTAGWREQGSTHPEVVIGDDGLGGEAGCGDGAGDKVTAG